MAIGGLSSRANDPDDAASLAAATSDSSGDKSADNSSDLPFFIPVYSSMSAQMVRAQLFA